MKSDMKLPIKLSTKPSMKASMNASMKAIYHLRIVYFLTLAVLFILVPFASQASRVAVTDSGTDFSHQWLKGRALVNEKELANNYVDDDRNGKVDDLVGWNFVDDYGRVFFSEHLQYVNQMTYKLFEVISKIQEGASLSAEEKKYWEEKVENLPNEKKELLKAHLNFFGQYAHSTHVSGIVASLSANAKIMSNRVFADTPLEELDARLNDLDLKNSDKKSELFRSQLLRSQGVADIFYKILAAVSNGIFDKVGVYLKEQEIDVVNYSLGINLQR